MTSVVKVFNTQLTSFFNDVATLFPDNRTIYRAKEGVGMAIYAKPSMIVDLWYTYVCVPYFSYIEAGDADYFVNKDYSEDIQKAKTIGGSEVSSDTTQKLINDGLIEPMRLLNESNRAKCMAYLLVLCKLAFAYRDAKSV